MQIELINKELRSIGLSASDVTSARYSTYSSYLTSNQSAYATAVASESTLKAAYEAADSLIDTLEDSVVDLEKELAYQQAVTEIRMNEGKIETQAILDLTLERALDTIAQAEEALELTISSYDMQIRQAEEAIETARSSVGHTDSSLLGQINQSKASLETSQNSIGYIERVYDYQIETAYLNIESALLQLDQYSVESPLSGVIENLSLEADTMVSTQSIIATISDYSTMEVEFFVGTEIKNELRLGQIVTFELDGTYYEGKINEINNVVDSSTKLFKVTALVNPDEEKFSNGASVRLTTGTFEEEQTIIIPYDAVIFSGGTSYVFKVVDGKAIKQFVEIGLFTENTISIVAGLEEGDEIITTWSEGLRDGVEVMVMNIEETEEIEIDEIETEGEVAEEEEE